MQTPWKRNPPVAIAEQRRGTRPRRRRTKLIGGDNTISILPIRDIPPTDSAEYPPIQRSRPHRPVPSHLDRRDKGPSRRRQRRIQLLLAYKPEDEKGGRKRTKKVSGTVLCFLGPAQCALTKRRPALVGPFVKKRFLTPFLLDTFSP